MEFHSQPVKISHFPDCANMSINGGEGSPPIGLGLELGRCSLQQSTNYGFTMFQLQELQLQSLIYKYLEVGIPVPCQLVIPIWKSVASSFHGLNITGVYQPYPSFLGCGPLNLEYRNDMDPEPGRCRRTDGKKWRCSKEAVPDQKYCERHIHRGRQRSRKLVEASQGTTSISTSATTTEACTNLSISLQMNGTTTISHSGTG